MFPLSLYLEQPSCSAELSTKIVQQLADPASRTPAADGQQPLQEQGGTPVCPWAWVASLGVDEGDRREGRKMGKMQESHRC